MTRIADCIMDHYPRPRRHLKVLLYHGAACYTLSAGGCLRSLGQLHRAITTSLRRLVEAFSAPHTRSLNLYRYSQRRPQAHLWRAQCSHRPREAQFDPRHGHPDYE